MSQRTPVTTSFGVLSIAIGAFYAVMSLMMVMTGHEAAAEAAGTSGGMATMIWLGGFGASILLIGAGVGLMKVAPWRRTLSMAYCCLALLVFGGWFMASRTTWFGLLPAIGAIYTVVFGVWAWHAMGGAAMMSSMRSTSSAPASSSDEDTKAAA